MWEWDYVADFLPRLLRGLVVTVEATLLGAALAYVLGLVLALLRRSPAPPLRWLVRGFVEFVRSTPLLVQLFFLFYVLPDFGILLPAFVTGVLGLGLHFSTYASEVYRAGIDGVPRGQWEAATALSLPRRRVWTSVILPQAIPRVIPALGNYLVMMFKYAPLLAIITVLGLLGVADEVASENFDAVEPLTMAAVFFLVISLISAYSVRLLERRLGHY